MLTIPDGVTVATEVFELVQVPPEFGVKLTDPFTQTEEELIVESGGGRTVIVKLVGEPVHPFKEGVTENMELICVNTGLSVKKEGIFPVAEVAIGEILIVVFVLDQV